MSDEVGVRSRARTPGRAALLVVTGVFAAIAAALTLVVATRWRPLRRLDLSVAVGAHHDVRSDGWLLGAARALTHLGDPVVVTLVTVVLALALLLRGYRRAALYLLVARLVAAVLSSGSKDLVQRPRPVWTDPVAHASSWSFPSGHALASAQAYTAIALVLLLLVPRVPRALLVVLAVLLPATVAATRVLLGVHFLSDVVAGLAMGWACAAGLAVLFFVPRDVSGQILPTAAGADGEHHR